jgi:Protein of unknown function (DUF992)
LAKVVVLPRFCKGRVAFAPNYEHITQGKRVVILKRVKNMNKLIGLSLFALAAFSPASQAASGIKIGILSCGIEGGIGYIIGSSKAIECVYPQAWR